MGQAAPAPPPASLGPVPSGIGIPGPNSLSNFPAAAVNLASEAARLIEAAPQSERKVLQGTLGYYALRLPVMDESGKPGIFEVSEQTDVLSLFAANQPSFDRLDIELNPGAHPTFADSIVTSGSKVFIECGNPWYYRNDGSHEQVRGDMELPTKVEAGLKALSIVSLFRADIEVTTAAANQQVSQALLPPVIDPCEGAAIPSPVH